MNKQMSRAEMAAHTVDLAEFLADTAPPARTRKGKGSEPFAKREEGRARRIERRQVRAAKSAWLNS